MSLTACPTCKGAISSEAAVCPLCGTATKASPAPAKGPSLASREANARLAAGKRLRTEDRAVLQREAEARGEHVSGFDKVTTGIALWAKMGAAICALILLCILLYGCVAAALH